MGYLRAGRETRRAGGAQRTSARVIRAFGLVLGRGAGATAAARAVATRAERRESDSGDAPPEAPRRRRGRCAS